MCLIKDGPQRASPLGIGLEAAGIMNLLDKKGKII